MVITVKIVQVRFWLLSVFLSMFNFFTWSFLNIQCIVDWCGQKGPQVVSLRLVACLFALFCFWSLYMLLKPVEMCDFVPMCKSYSPLSPSSVHGLTCEMELSMLINTFYSSFLYIYVFIYVTSFLSRSNVRVLVHFGACFKRTTKVLAWGKRSATICHNSQNPTSFAFNALIRARSKSAALHRSFLFYNRILLSTGYLTSKNYTFTFLVCISAHLLAHGTGSSIHGVVVKHGFEHKPCVQKGLIYMYAGLDGLVACHWVSSSICEPDLVY